MDEKEREMAKKFFAEWVTDRPSGDPVTDAGLMCRNAFAVASLRRRNLFEKGGEMYYRNQALLSALGSRSEQEFEWMEQFLEKAQPDLAAPRFKESLEAYFDRMLSLMRSSTKLDDLR